MHFPPQHEFDPNLLDYHLGQLSEPEQRAFQRRLVDDPSLAAENEALAGVLDALGCLRDTATPPGLAERVRARVAAAPALRVSRAAAADLELLERENGRRIIPMHNFRDIAAVAAMIVIAVGVGVPGVLHLRERNQRMACAYNLAQVGRGVQAYATVFSDNLPFVGWNGGNSWQPSNDPRVLVCPGGRDVPMATEQLDRRQDFIESRNISYAYQNMAGVRPSLRSDPDLPIFADDTPLFADGLPLFDLRRLAGDPAALNSRSHGGHGQNILTLDGRSVWTTTPFVGVHGNNIWTLDGVTEYTGREGPQSATDSHLLK
jgi:hypothetical protein